MFDEYATEVDPKYRGVGGWLLLFIIGVVFLGPLLTAVGVLRTLADLDLLVHIPTLYVILIVISLFEVLLTFFGVVAGVVLWVSKTPLSVSVAQWYLLVRGFFVVLSNLFLLINIHEGRIPAIVKAALFMTIYYWLAIGLIPVVIWYSYLMKSKRVAATYYAADVAPAGDAPPPPPDFRGGFDAGGVPRG